MEMCSNNIQTEKIMFDNKIIEQVSEFKYSGYVPSDHVSDMEIKLQSHLKINYIIKRNF
jgi:hypothetical protein